MRKYLLLAGLILVSAAPAIAQQTPKHPELAGIPSARPGVKAERFVFEYFKTSPDAIFNIARVTVSPGQFLPVHTHTGPEFHYMVAGELEEIDGKGSSKTIKTGDWGVAKEGEPHGLKNSSAQPATFLAVIVGKKGERLTKPFKK